MTLFNTYNEDNGYLDEILIITLLKLVVKFI